MGGGGNLKSNFIKIYNFEFTRTALQCLRGCDRGGRVPQELPGHRPPLLLAAWRIGAHRFIEPSSAVKDGVGHIKDTILSSG